MIDWLVSSDFELERNARFFLSQSVNKLMLMAERMNAAAAAAAAAAGCLLLIRLTHGPT